VDTAGHPDGTTGMGDSIYYDAICYNDVMGDNVYNINSITADVLRDIFADVCLPDNQNQQGAP